MEPRPSILMRKGQEKRDDCFRNIHLCNYRYEVQETNDHWMVTTTERLRDEMIQNVVEILESFQ